jgi:hypothetical protein
MHLFERNSYLCHRVSYETRIFLLLNYPAELQPRKGFNEQIQISIGAAHHSADSTIGYLGLLQAWQDIWDGACAFFMPIPIVLPPTRL